MRCARARPIQILISSSPLLSRLPSPRRITLPCFTTKSGMADEVSNAPRSDKTKMVSEGPVMEVPPQPQENPANAFDDVDFEKYGAGRESNPLPELKRKLKSRHLQMIAIGESTTAEALRLWQKFLITHTHTNRIASRWDYWNWSFHR